MLNPVIFSFVSGLGFFFCLVYPFFLSHHECNSYTPQYAHEINDTLIQFRSPTIISSPNQHLRTFILLDNWKKELKPFDYHPDPSFNELTKNVITETSIIIVTVSTDAANRLNAAAELTQGGKKITCQKELRQTALLSSSIMKMERCWIYIL